MVVGVRSVARSLLVWLRSRWLLVASLAIVGWLGCGFAAAWSSTRPWPSAIAPRARIAGRLVQEVATTTADGLTVRGWLVRAASERGCVVLAAGIRGNRTAMVSRAECYLERGWSTLLVDLRGTGASDSSRIAMGWHEANDLLAWHAFLRAQGLAVIAVHGQSLGAAAAVFTMVRGAPAPAWHFAVLEACYRDIRAALAARLPALPEPLLWPLVASAELLLGIDADELAPVRAIAQLRCPTLLVGGELDRKVGPGAAAALFAASGAAVKVRCDVPGAGHVDLWRAGGELMPRALGQFLAER